jgi:hypothetical protein
MPTLFCLLFVRFTTMDLVSHAGLVDFLTRHCGPAVILLGILRIVGSDVERLRFSDTVRRMFSSEPGVSIWGHGTKPVAGIALYESLVAF